MWRKLFGDAFSCFQIMHECGGWKDGANSKLIVIILGLSDL